MPEERDEEFSNILLKKILASAQSFGLNDFELEIKEQYTIEAEPHYHFHVGFGSCANLQLTVLSATYIATEKGTQYEGTMNLTLKTGSKLNIDQIMITGAFFLYDEYIREYYPEWKTTYREIKLSPDS